MIAQRLAELQKSANRWQEKRLSQASLISSTTVSERKSAFLQRNSIGSENKLVAPTRPPATSLTNQPSVYKKEMASDNVEVKVAKPELGIGVYRRGILEERKNKLVESSEKWRSRVHADPELENLEAVGRMRKDHKCKVMPTRTPAIDIGKGLDRFYSSCCSVSPPSKLLHISDAEFDDITSHTPKLLVPSRPLARRRVRNRATHRLPEFSSPIVSSAPVTPLDYRLKKEESKDDVSETGIAISAKKGLQSKLDYSAVKLKKAEVKSPYPDLMLIRIKGEKHADVRLVAPKYSSIHAYAVFILLTPMRLFLYTGKYANLIEKTKATQIATSVCSKNGELGCYAKQVEYVGEQASGSEFWKLLGCTDGESFREDYVPDQLLQIVEPFEEMIAATNIIFKIAADNSVFTFSSAEVPKYSVFHPSANLVFDFGSEIYVWAGRSADRNGTRQALAYAEELRSQSAPHIKNAELLFGDSFDGGRPSWCVLMKMAQGLGDALFRHKFHDWKTSTVRLSNRWEMRPPKRDMLNVMEEEAMAVELGRSLAANCPKESVLILEETELERRADNVFTEGLQFMVLEGENELRELDAMHMFASDACYVIKWEYRVERTGIHKLDGGKREHDTGRRRIAYFFWLGSNTTKKQQGLCALALRDLDRDRHPHERVLQNQEPPLFLQFFNGSMIVTGTGTNVFVVLGSSLPSEYRMVELSEPIVFRSHGVYVIVRDTVTVWYGARSKEIWRNAGLHLAKHILDVRDAYFENLNESDEVIEVSEEDGAFNIPVISADNWEQAPRLIRLYETDGKDVTCQQWDTQLPFSFTQRDLKDTMLVDQGTKLWLWTEDVASTYALRVVNSYWRGRNGPKCVICKTREPDAFKALFPEWDNFIDEAPEDESVQVVPQRWDPCDLDELLRSRTQYWPLEKVVARDLPSGVDLKRLEQYLNDKDFETVFEMDRQAFYSLPHWKQIELRKKHQLF
uniref:Supervillin n=1 Tax=Ascaris suum TaxID=6253 RepID=F1KTD5_ASCSU